ncbi:MAG: hypothetical protein AAF252_08215 [Pseudomonadota bacterium]
MKMSKIAAATLCSVTLMSGALHAATVSNAASGLSNPDTLVTFDEVPLAQNTPVSNQYEGFGLTVSPGLQVHRLHFPLLNLSGRNLSNYSPIVRTFSLFFAEEVQDATFSMITHTGTSTFTAKLQGAVVETFAAPTRLLTSVNFFGFTDIRFDEIEVTAGGFNGAMILDNVAFNVAEPIVTNVPSATPLPVPVPGSLPVMVGGMIAFGLLRARRRAA